MLCIRQRLGGSLSSCRACLSIECILIHVEFSPAVAQEKAVLWVTWLALSKLLQKQEHGAFYNMFRFVFVLVVALFLAWGEPAWDQKRSISPPTPWLPHLCGILPLVAESWDLYCPRTSRQVDPSPLQTPQLSSLMVLPSWWSQPTI